MIRLGIRLATAGGRGALAGLGLTAIAVAIGTAVLLFALSFAPALADRDARTAWRDSFPLSEDQAAGTLLLMQSDRLGERLLTRVHVAPAGPGAVAVPPGIDRLPEPGTAYVSPALAALLDATPADQLGDRFGRVVGRIPDDLLASPDELVAIIGTERAVMEAQGAAAVSAFASEAAPLELPPIGALIVILAAVGALAPVAVFVATATRMSAARRELRLAAMRLVGATPAQVARLAVIEALLATALGAIGGVLLFAAMRPLVARIPVNEMTWWPHAIVPPPPAALVLLGVVQLVGAAAALIAMRRVTITPLGVQRRAAPPAPGAVRLVPLIVAVAALVLAVRWYRGNAGETLALAAAGLAFAAVVVGIALVGPWLTAMVGRGLHRTAWGAATLLAARRLGDEPRSSFGAIAGVIMAVFVASSFFTFAAFAARQAGEYRDPMLGEHGVVAWMGASGESTRGLGDRIAAMEGVSAILEVREVELVTQDGIHGWGWIASCHELVAVLALTGATCPAAGIATTGTGVPAGTYELYPAASISGEPPGREITVRPGAAPPLLAVEDELGGFLPPVLVDPSAMGGSVDDYPLTRLLAATDGSTEAGERIRTAVVAAVPTGSVRTAQDHFVGNETFAEIGRVVALGLVGTLALAGASLAVAVTTATLERRRQFVFLRSAGMPASALRSVILIQAGAPLVVVAAFSAALGLVVANIVLLISGAEIVPAPDVSLLVTLAASLLVAMAVVALTLPPLERMTRPVSLRHE